MKKLFIFFVLLTGKLLAQTQPLHFRTVTDSVKNWKVGDKIDAGAPDYMFHQALVLALNDEKNSLKVHYLDVSYPDGWVDKKITRPYNLQFKADSAAAAGGLRPGKYVMYIYPSDVGYYQGYFIIHEDGSYEYFSDNNNTKTALHPASYSNGKGEYSFNKISGIIKWLSGPFLNLDGTSHLSASIDGSAYVIQSLSSDGLSGTYYNKR